MMQVEVRDATEQDAYTLAPHLRQSDIDELAAGGHYDPEAALVESFSMSEVTKAIIVDGGVVALFGVANAPGNTTIGVPWMLGSAQIESITYRVMKHCREWVEQLAEGYVMLTNAVDCRNVVSIKWLHYCGFEFVALVPDYGPEEHPFIVFAR